MVGIGSLLTASVTGDSGWIAPVPGFLIAGIGAGLVHPPLASVAVIGAVLSFVLIRARDFVTESQPAPQEQPGPQE